MLEVEATFQLEKTEPVEEERGRGKREDSSILLGETQQVFINVNHSEVYRKGQLPLAIQYLKCLLLSTCKVSSANLSDLYLKVTTPDKELQPAS